MRRLADWKARTAAALALRDVPETRGLKLVRCIKSGSEASVFEGVIKDRPVVMKRMTGEDAITRAQAMTDELRAQYPRMKDGPFRVPEPITTVPKKRLVVMERAPGKRLDQVLREDPAARPRILRRASLWLAHYIGERRVEDNFGGGFWIKTRRRAMNELAEGEDRDRVSGLIGIMETERNRIGPLPITRVRSHGDFCALNLMVDGDTIWGVDIQNNHWLALAKDLARFLVYLEITQPHGTYDGPCGLSGEDCEALLGTGGLIREREAEAMMPYFVATELSGRLMTEIAHPDVMENARRLADRILA